VSVITIYKTQSCAICKPVTEKINRYFQRHIINGSVKIEIVDLTENLKLAGELGINGVPTVIVSDDIGEIERFTGSMINPVAIEYAITRR